MWPEPHPSLRVSVVMLIAHPLPQSRGPSATEPMENVPFSVTHWHVHWPHLHPGWDGARLAQFSDIHISRWNRAQIRHACQLINGWAPDLVLYTGDSIDRGTRYLDVLEELLSPFEARIAKLCCMGNHDYQDGARGQHVKAVFQRAGYRLLCNELTTLERNGGSLQVAGADDLFRGQQDLEATFRHRNPDEPLLLLNHNPQNFEHIATHWKPDLMLSGHTHGSQIRFPMAIRRWVAESYFVEGHHQHHNSHLYINRGLGTSSVYWDLGWIDLSWPSFRFQVPREVTLYTLKASEPPRS